MTSMIYNKSKLMSSEVRNDSSTIILTLTDFADFDIRLFKSHKDI